MSTVRFGPRDLLEYDARYGVLICRECRYAIQKSALQSHLLRHKIYRLERQDLLGQIAPLQLLEPHEVPLPPAATSPIEALPVIPGYRCLSVGCGCLYASSKRMKRHQSETHGRGDASDILSYARPASLQTFFRGTKLRYFEVTGQVPDNPDCNVDIGNTNESDPWIATPPRVLPPPEAPPRSSLLDFDLDTLTYFHHFLTTASPTLPGPGGRIPVKEYWEANVVPHALRNRWLMCGLLAISAGQLATDPGDTVSSETHRNHSVQFFVEFTAGWDAAAELTDLLEEISLAASQIRGVLRCAHWAGLRSAPHASSLPELTGPSQLQSMLTTVRGFAGSEFPLHVNISPDTTFGCLQTLPSQMADMFGKPDDVRDVLATLSAISALVECCDMGLAYGQEPALWRATTDWLTRVPGRFHDLILCDDPAALVVVAHWAVLLVQSVEYSGCWFFRGLSTRMVREIVTLIPDNDAVVRSFVESLIP